MASIGTIPKCSLVGVYLRPLVSKRHTVFGGGEGIAQERPSGLQKSSLDAFAHALHEHDAI